MVRMTGISARDRSRGGLDEYLNNLIGRYKLLDHGTFEQDGEFRPTSCYLKGELIIYRGSTHLASLRYFN